MRRRALAFTALFLSISLLSRPRFGTATISVGYNPEKTAFSVAYRGETSTYKITPLFVLPGEEVKVQIQADGEAAFAVEGMQGKWTMSPAREWTWKAPAKTGSYTARVKELNSGESMTLNIFVMVPYGKMKGGAINGYKIGDYPKVASKKEIYTVPRGFIEVTPENKNTLVSPHFKLGQFLCKQDAKSYPKYIVLRERLVFKMEVLLEHVNAEGIPARTFSVMSGYRTPHYNKLLGNVKLSRHVWGDAADIYINHNPGVVGMEDLNGDGKSDAKDARKLYDVMGELKDDPLFKPFEGGLGWYKPTKSHGPFVHIDARGTPARWNSN